MAKKKKNKTKKILSISPCGDCKIDSVKCSDRGTYKECPLWDRYHRREMSALLARRQNLENRSNDGHILVSGKV